MRLCPKCQKPLNKYCRLCSNCLPSNYQHVKNSRYKTKQMAIDYLGGKCVICGYNKCNRALSFHHLDPNEKDFSISHIINRAWENIVKELDKCILVCANCHMEIEDGLINMDQYFNGRMQF